MSGYLTFFGSPGRSGKYFCDNSIGSYSEMFNKSIMTKVEISSVVLAQSMQLGSHSHHHKMWMLLVQ